MRSREQQEEVALNWLKHIAKNWLYQYYDSAIDPVAEELINQMEENLGGENNFNVVWEYITRLRNMYREQDGSVLSEPEILLRCAFAAAKCKVYSEALQLCREAYPKLTAHKHPHGIALWTLGTLQWLFAHQHDQALRNWERGKSEDFQSEEIRYADTEQGGWYSDRISEMETAIRRGSINNTIPPLYDIIPPTIKSSKLELELVQAWLNKAQNKLVSNLEKTILSPRLKEIQSRIFLGIKNRDDKILVLAIEDLLKLEKDRTEDFVSILDVKIETAIKIIKLGYYDTAKMLLVATVRGYPNKTSNYGSALWVLGCLECFFDQDWVLKNWKYSYRIFHSLAQIETEPNKAKWYYQQLEEIQQAISIYQRNSASKFSSQVSNPTYSTLTPNSKHHTTIPDTDKERGSHLVLNSIPIYSEVRAGPDGPLWFLPQYKDERTHIREIILENKNHVVYSVKKGDNEIALSAQKKYGWAKVRGQSMNAALPISIKENDFVLFYITVSNARNFTQANFANNYPEWHGKIVLASWADETAHGYKYMLKRYNASDLILTSETHSKDNLYSPVSLSKSIQIIGIVVGVAKSI